MALPVSELANLVIPILNQLIGSHRRLLEVLRQESEALALADLKVLQEATFSKEVLVHTISETEYQRRRLMGDQALSQLIQSLANEDSKLGVQLQELKTTLVVLVQKASEHNQRNQGVIEKSLTHVDQMKRGFSGPVEKGNETYTPKGYAALASGSQRSTLIERKV